MSRKFPQGVIIAVLLSYAGWVIFPMIWVAYSSLKPDAAIFRDTFALPAANNLRFDLSLIHI